MTPREAERIILDAGWVFDRQRGSHRQYRHPTRKGTVTIPFHKGDLRKGTADSILKQAGLK
jgi:predicted RNA binding protein YcfA (HicA-like mRNA interferase family)